ncbi:MAG: ABC transporter substrate-binding protein [Roseburia sp.]|nr:ABC transporter substrate-binding protein [Roseburia sp.]
MRKNQYRSCTIAGGRRRRHGALPLTAVLILSLFLCTGCGHLAGQETEEKQQKPLSDRDFFDWRTEQVKAPGEVQKGSYLYITEYYPYTDEIPSENRGSVTTKSAFLGDDYYKLVTCSFQADDGTDSQNTSSRKYLFSVDGESKQMNWQELPWLAQKDWNFLTVLEDGPVFLNIEYDKDEETQLYSPLHIFVLYTDWEGNILEQTDLLTEYTALGLIESGEKPLLPRSCIPGDGNYYYLTDLQSLILYGMDGQGNTKTILDFTNQRQALIQKGQAYDGSPLFANWNFDTKATDIYDVNQGAARVLASLANIRVTKFYLSETGLCYLISDKDLLYCYDLKTGSLTEIYDMKAGGINDTTSLIMSSNQNGELLLYTTGSLERALLVLSPEPPEAKMNLRFVDIRNDTYLQGCAASFSRKNPGILITCEKTDPGSSQDYNDQIDRLSMELMTGNGPDLLCIDSDTMRLFWEKGLLMDMTDMIPEETTEQVFPIVMNSGKIDGRQAGITLSGYVETLAVSKKYWNQKSWNILDFISVVETYQDGCDGLGSCYMQPEPAHLLRMITTDLEHSPFVDLEGGVSYFDSDDFIHTLEVLKDCKQKKIVDDYSNGYKQVEKGELIAVPETWIMDFHSYSSMMSYLGTEAFLVGCPTDTASGNFYMPYSILVANASASPEKKELIAQFAEYVLNMENQRQNYTGVIREDVLREFTDEDYGATYHGEPQAAFYVGDGHYLMLDSKKDGSSYLEEYLAFLDDCLPYPDTPSALSNIIWEEAESYFNGDRSAKEAAAIIQNRAKLYLEETKSQGQ